jgi:predicted O-methyltransferase YrrM
MLNLARALKIPGFTNERELTWLAEKASQCRKGPIVEIGSWMGRSTVAMADNLRQGVKLYAVDTWKGSGKEHEKELSGMPEHYLRDEFAKNVGKDLLSGPDYTVRPLQEESLAAADYLCKHYGNRFEMIFIDAAHDYESVKADILTWLPFLQPGGVFCGHDFDGGRPGVVKAARECVPNLRMANAGSIWVMG